MGVDSTRGGVNVGRVSTPEVGIAAYHRAPVFRSAPLVALCFVGCAMGEIVEIHL